MHMIGFINPRSDLPFRNEMENSDTHGINKVLLNVSDSVSLKNPQQPNAGCGIFLLIVCVIFILVGYNYDSMLPIFLGILGVGFGIMMIIPFRDHSICSPASICFFRKRMEAMEDKSSLKYEILQKFVSRAEAQTELKSINRSLELLYKKLPKVTNTKKQEYIKERIEFMEKEMADRQQIIDNAIFNIFCDDSEKEAFDLICKQFKKMAASQKIWNIYGKRAPDHLKSSAELFVNRLIVKFSLQDFPIVDDHAVPRLVDKNHTFYYLFPHFLVRKERDLDFSVFPLSDGFFVFTHQLFSEKTDLCPSDATIVEQTYTYVNKDGTPDKRFSNNPLINVLNYGLMGIPAFGLEFHISNCGEMDQFGKLLNTFIQKENREGE